MRNILNINEGWIFVKDMNEAPASLPQTGEKVNLPHTWNALDGQDDRVFHWQASNASCSSSSISYTSSPTFAR